MKRLFLIPLCLCMCLCSCAETAASSEVMAHLITDAQGVPATYFTYFSDANEESKHYLTTALEQSLYGDGVDLYTLCEDFAILIGSSDIPYEIHILRARAVSGVPELLDALTRRKDQLQQRKNTAFRAQIAERTEDAIAFSDGRTVFLFVTDDNRLLKERLG